MMNHNLRQFRTNQIDSCTTSTFDLSMPQYLLFEHWDRHKLSEADIVAMLSSIPVKVLWFAVLFHGGNVSQSEYKPSYSRRGSTLFSGRIKAIKILLQLSNEKKKNKKTQRNQAEEAKEEEHKNLIINNVIDVDTSTTLGFVPAVPRHVLSVEDMCQVKQLIVPNLSMFKTNKVPGLFQLGDMLLLPRTIVGNAVYCVVVQPMDDFRRDWRRKQNVLATTPYAIVGDGSEHVLTEESLLLSTTRERVF